MGHDKENLDKLAKEVSFVQRETNRLSGSDFFQLMSIEQFGNKPISLEGMADILRNISPESGMSPQALNQKINVEQAVTFLRSVFEERLRNQLKSATEKIPLKILDFFPKVYIQDSTQIELNEHLAEEFAGSGGCASKSALKIDLIYEIRRHVLENVLISEATIPDQKRAAAVHSHMGKGDLIIRDLGYFVIKDFKKIVEKEAFYLSRLQKNITVYLGREEQETIDIASYAKEKIGNRGFIDLNIYIGADKQPCRLVIYRAPEEVINKRKREEKKIAEKKGKVLSKERLNWLEFSFYITNVTEEVWPAEVIGTIYRIRWQIELIFKQWKQLFHLHIMAGTHAERVLCFLYGRLAMIIIVNSIYAYSAWYAFETMGREVSPVKLIQWLQRKGRLVNALVSNRLASLLEELLSGFFKGICKQRRKRKTTFELLDKEISFIEVYG